MTSSRFESNISSQWSDRGELSDVFTQLDVVLSLPVFDNLVRVLIHVEFGKHHRRLHEEEMQQWAYLMKPCLASLDKRGVLKIDTSGGISTWVTDRPMLYITLPTDNMPGPLTLQYYGLLRF